MRFFCRGDLQVLGPFPGRLASRLSGRGRARCSCSAPTGSGGTCSRGIIYGARISLTIGLLGIAVSFVLGISIGGLAGYYGGWVDIVVQRFIEMMRSFPELPLWMALSAALPVTWSPILVYFGITIILGLLDWTGARARGALEAAGAARGGFRHRRGAHGRDARADHRPPPAAELHEPSDRLGDAVDPEHDPGRDGAVASSASACGRRSPAGACC